MQTELMLSGQSVLHVPFPMAEIIIEPLYDPEIEPSLNMTRDEYRKHISTTINHFYEKLFRLKELLNTSTAKEIAEHRDRFMHEYVDEFLLEWEGKR